MSLANYKSNSQGMKEMLNSDGMLFAMTEVAHAIEMRAREIAPVGPPSDPHRGRYRASFVVRSHKHGGATRDRAEAIVSNFAPEALYVEFGTEGREPYHTMLRAATETRI
jgi:hypothetical protein